MSLAAPLIVINGRVVLPDGGVARGAVRCEGDRIVAVGPDVAPQDGDRVHDAAGHLIAPERRAAGSGPASGRRE